MNRKSEAYVSQRPEEELALWISRASKGHREEQKLIYDLLAARCYRVIRKIVGESHADDVMQDFIIHLFCRLSQFRFESSLETWAHRIAVNQSLQYLRKMEREERRIQYAATIHKKSIGMNHQIEVDEDIEILELAMQQISGEQRAILHMKEVDGLGYAAIASVLGIPEGTVGSRLNKARNELRNSLIRLGWEE
jgi:RNA polymerase sigma-70 factor (ECF subfamily)